ncbi:MAG TPA: HAMP domain-containing sensor histidine kinase [Anaeromyxobacter sp.]|nr:HAMP domain-containing sensor histidine kinase [Anaeromyxobacter sp.]
MVVGSAAAVPPAPSPAVDDDRAQTPDRAVPMPGPPRPGAFRLGTRRRLQLAFAALAAAFAVAFGWQVAGLARIEEQLAYLHEHEHQMRVALDVASGLRSLYSPHAPVGVARPPSDEARRRVFDQIAMLTAVVDEPEAIVWIADIAAAARELERSYGQGGERAFGPALGEAGEGRLHQLMFDVEVNADHFFSFLRDRVAEQSGAVGELQRRTLRAAIVFVVGTLLLAATLAVYLSRAIARPLAVLGAGAARIASGDLATRIEIGRADEFGALASEFNQMAESLRLHQERLVRSEKLAGLGRVAAGIAHELNNPLQVMLGYVSLDRGRVKGEVGQHLARIEREAVRCKQIVDALLQLSRPVASAFAAERVDLWDVCEEVAEALRIALGEAVPAIVVQGSGVSLGTRSRFRQVVFNLAKNAADAAGPGGAVRIDVARTGPVVEVAVSDTGPGIAPELRDRIFEPFFTTKASGTGLGLAIARAMAESLGGDIELDGSRRDGARFVVRVPAADTTA